MIDIAEFKGYLIIDQHALDIEISRQPSLLEKVGDAYAVAAAERDALKEELAIVDAFIEDKVRKAKRALKITEGAVEMEVQLSKDHQAAFNAYLAAKKHADRLGALKDSFHSRGYMLRDLVQLYTARYYDDTSVKSDAKSDSYTYERRRARLAEGRRARNAE